MASIQSTIQLVDRITSPVNNMISALNNLCGAYEDVDNEMQSSFNSSRIDSARAAINQAAEQVASCRREIDESEQSQENFNRAIRGGVQESNELMKKIGGFVAAFASVATVKKAMDLSDELTLTSARLDMMNDGFQTTAELQNMIYQSAQRSRGVYQESADAVAKMGIMAKDAFDSNAELVAFVEQLNKQFSIAGTSQEGVSAAMLQLTQAMSSGVLRGEELNSVFEQAPTIIQSIADYLDVPIGQIRAMAAEGQITSEIVKNSLLSATEETNAKFKQIPMTWGQVWTSMQNQAIMAFQPVLNKINELANNESFQAAIDAVINSLVFVAEIALSIMDVLGGVISFVAENWNALAPIILTVAAALLVYKGAMIAVKIATAIASAVQAAHNAILAANPIMIVVMAILVLIAVIYSICQTIAKFTGIANSGFGVICGGVMVVIGFFKNLGLAIANIALGIWEALKACCENVWAVFHNVFCDLQSMWYGFLKVVMDVVKGVVDVLNYIPFVNIDTNGLTAASQEYANKAAEAQNSKTAFKDVGEAFSKGASTFDAFQDGWAEDAFNSGAAWGDGVVDGINSAVNDMGDLVNTDVASLEAGSGYDQSQMASNVSDIAGNTARTADALDISSEDLKYLRDIAERDVINRFTTAEVKIEWNNTQNINSDMDLDGVVDYLATNLQEAIETTAEGVHA